VRERRGWSQEDLASAVTRLGYPISRAVISELERPKTPRSRRVTLNDVMAISYALGVAPLHMIVPLEDDAAVGLTEQVGAKEAQQWVAPLGAKTVREWMRGDLNLGDPRVYEREKPVAEQPQGSWWPALSDLRRWTSNLAARFSAPPLDDDEAMAAIQQVRAALDVIANKVETLRSELRVRELEFVRDGVLPALGDPTVPAVAPISRDDPMSQGARRRRGPSK
jgi:transcriptional regulator with XRE-family HTH domain